MRSSSGWHRPSAGSSPDVWPDDLGGFPPAAMLAVELGLYLLGRVMPGRPARDAWTLFGGYPYAEASGHARTDEPAAARSAGPATTCGRCAAAGSGSPTWSATSRCHRAARLPASRPRRNARTAGRRHEPPARFEKFEELLTIPAGVHPPAHPAGDGGAVPVPGPRPPPLGHLQPGARRRPAGSPRMTWHAGAGGRGEAITVTWADLQAAAARDGRERGRPPRRTAGRLGEPAQPGQAARPAGRRLRGRACRSRIAGLLHLVGMVGAGKSTLRDILTYWCVTKDTGAIGG